MRLLRQHRRARRSSLAPMAVNRRPIGGQHRHWLTREGASHTIRLLRTGTRGGAVHSKEWAIPGYSIRVLLYLAAGVAFIAGCWSIRRGFNGPALDFTSAIWAPGEALLAGSNPYQLGVTEQQLLPGLSPFPLYGPPHLLLAAFISLIPLGIGGDIWQIICLIAMFGYCVWTVQSNRTLPTWARGPLILAVFGFVMIARAGQSLYQLGQPSILYFALFWLAIRRYDSNDWMTALIVTLLLGKPNYALPLLVFLAVDGRWRLITKIGALTAVISLPLMIVLVQAQGSLTELIESLRRNAHFFSRLDSDPRIDLATMVTRSLDAHSELLNWAVAIIILVPTALLVRHFRRRGASPELLAFIMALASLVAVAHHNYDVWVALLVPFAAALNDRLRASVALAMAPAVGVVLLHTPLPLPNILSFRMFSQLLAGALMLGLVGLAVSLHHGLPPGPTLQNESTAH